MLEPSTVVRLAVVLYVLVAGASAALMWINAGAPDAIRNTGIAIASTLPLLVAIVSYFRTETLETRASLVLIFDAQKGTLTTGGFNAYDSMLGLMLAELPRESISATQSTEFMGDKGMDIVERGLMLELQWMFGLHWDVITREEHGPHGIPGRAATVVSMDAPKTQIAAISLRHLFRHNPLMINDSFLGHSSMNVPPGTKLHVGPTIYLGKGKSGEAVPPGKREIRFENSFANTVITISPSSAVAAGDGVWGVVRPDQNPFRYGVITYDISLKMTPTTWRRYAPEMDAHLRWFRTISSLLERLDWHNIEKQIDRSMMRKALDERLSTAPTQ